MALSLAAGRKSFNRGDYWDAHEEWEEVWRKATGDEKVWIQGLIQLAAAVVNQQKGKPASAGILGRRARDKLAGAPPVLYGVDMVAAREACASLATDEPIVLSDLRL